ncbi:MAG: DNA-binding protein HU-beta [Candidatus Phytoplasma cynodontis]|nr:MAG: DNA-binding protein HU-beta [Candidatus Phytoplasma cynodontis]
MTKKNTKKESNKITQQELITKIAKQTRYSSKEVHNVLQAFKENLFKTLSQGKGVSFSPIGTFKIKKVPAKKGIDIKLVNPKIPKNKRVTKIIHYPAHQTVSFHFSDDFKQAIKKALN